MNLVSRGLSWLSDQSRRLTSIRRLSRSEALYRTKLGCFWVPNRPWGDTISRQITASKIFDAQVLELVKTYYLPGTSVLDVGANLGQMTVLIANHAKEAFVANTRLGRPNYFVYSFEAQPRIVNLLYRNVIENGLTDVVKIHTNPVWDSPGEFLSFPSDNPSLFSNWGSNGVRQTVDSSNSLVSVSIDSLEIPDHVSVMKVDVQGADFRAILGAKALIERDRPALIFEYEHDLSVALDNPFDQFIDLLGALRYRLVWTVQNDFLALPQEKSELDRTSGHL